MPGLRTLRFPVAGAGLMTADVDTAHRDGFRVLRQPPRVVLDIRT